MASITQLPNGRYYCQIRRKGSKSLYKTFDTRKDAEVWVGLRDIHMQYSEKSNKRKKVLSRLLR